MAHDRQRVPPTVGQQLLLGLLKDCKQKKLAEKTGLAQSVISELRNRWAIPSLRQALALEKQGIPCAAWEQPAEETAA